MRRREEIRARRIAMGVDPQVPAFNSRGRLSEQELGPPSPQPAHEANACASDSLSLASRGEGEDAGSGEGRKVRYYRLPDGSLLRQTDSTPHDRVVAERAAAAPAPPVPEAAGAGAGVAAGPGGSEDNPAAGSGGGVAQGV